MWMLIAGSGRSRCCGGVGFDLRGRGEDWFFFEFGRIEGDVFLFLRRLVAYEEGFFVFIDFAEAENVIRWRRREWGLFVVFVDDIAGGELKRGRQMDDVIVRGGRKLGALTRAGFRLVGSCLQDAILPSPILPPWEHWRGVLANWSVRKVNGAFSLS
jgi:hypothetical protein